MSKLLRVLNSSIGRKYLMGVTGLLLCGFLVSHLAGNLLIFGGQEQFNAYAAKLNSLGPLLWVAEAGLMALFLLHIYLAVTLTTDNRKARGRYAYELKETKQDTSVLNVAPRTWMFVSGSVVLVFLLWHLIDIRFGIRDKIDPTFAYPVKETQAESGRAAVYLYQWTIAVLRTPLTAIIYVVGTVFLGFHLSHGFASAFRSLGIAHPAYSPWIYRIGLVFAAAMTIGFASIPIYVWAADVQVPPPVPPVDEATMDAAEEASLPPRTFDFVRRTS